MREAASAIFDRRLQPAPKKPSEFEREDRNPCLLPFIPHFVAGTCTPVALVIGECRAAPGPFFFFFLAMSSHGLASRAESRGDGELPSRTAEVVVLTPSLAGAGRNTLASFVSMFVGMPWSSDSVDDLLILIMTWSSLLCFLFCIGSVLSPAVCLAGRRARRQRRRGAFPYRHRRGGGAHLQAADGRGPPACLAVADSQLA